MKKILFIILFPSLLYAQGRFVRHGRRGDTTGVTVLKVDSYARFDDVTSSQVDSTGGNVYYDGENLFLYDGTNNIFVDLTGAGGSSGLGVYDITTYGAAGDCTDCYTYIQAAYNAAEAGGGGIVFWPHNSNGKYRSSSKITITEDIRTLFDPGVVFYPDTIAFHAYGAATGDTTSLKDTVTVNQTKITCYAPEKMDEGNLVKMISTSGKWYASNSYRKGEIFESHGARVDTLYRSSKTWDNYLPANDVVLTEYTPISVAFEDVTIQYMVGDSDVVAFYVDYGKDVKFDNVKIDKAGYTGITLRSCIRSSIKEGSITRSNKKGAGYGIALLDCEGIDVGPNNYFYECRHGVTQNAIGTDLPTRITDVFSNQLYGGTFLSDSTLTAWGANSDQSGTGVDLHEGAEDVKVRDNEIYGYATGVGARGYNVLVDGNSFSGDMESMVVISGKNMRVINNIYDPHLGNRSGQGGNHDMYDYGLEQMINFDDDNYDPDSCDYVDVVNNTVLGLESCVLYVSENPRNLRVNNNHISFRQEGAGTGYFILRNDAADVMHDCDLTENYISAPCGFDFEGSDITYSNTVYSYFKDGEWTHGGNGSWSYNYIKADSAQLEEVYAKADTLYFETSKSNGLGIRMRNTGSSGWAGSSITLETDAWSRGTGIFSTNGTNHYFYSGTAYLDSTAWGVGYQNIATKSGGAANRDSLILVVDGPTSKVGINDYTPSHALDVNGRISGKPVMIQSSAPASPQSGDLWYLQGASGNPDTLCLYVGATTQKFVGTVNQP